MTVSHAIKVLQSILKKSGDVNVVFDCPGCGRVVSDVVIELGPPVATLKGIKP